MTVISSHMKMQYDQEGYVQARGLIPLTVVDRAAETLLALHADDDEAKVNRAGSVHKAYEHPDLRALYTPEVYEAIALLVGDSPENLAPPTIPYTIIIPKALDSAMSEFPHIDWMKADSLTDPGFRITVMTYLTDVDPSGGGTLVWPGSSNRVRELVHDRENYPTHADLQVAINTRRETFGDAVETTPRKGDVVFIDSWMVHAGGINRNDRPRLALNWKW